MAQVRTPEQDAVTPAPEGAGAREPVSARPRATLAARMLRRDGRFAAAIAAVLAASAFALTMGGAAMRPATPPPAGSAAPTATVAATATPARVTAQVVPANERRYDLPGPNAGLMQPAVDARGDVWFGEMNTNQLGRLDPGTGAVTTWQPPNGQYNIMEAVADPAGNIWFTEQAADYIGRFDPAAQRFTTYPLEQVGGHSAAPQGIALDAAGNVWFTEISAAKVGRLNPDTGKITTWAVPAPVAGQPAYPFSIAVTPTGAVWFGYLSGGALGRLDPVTGQTQLVHLSSADAQVFSMAADDKGRIWFTELEQGKLGMLDTVSGQVAEIAVPQPLGTNAGLYGVAVARDGAVWFASAGENALVRYEPDAARFTFYQLATPSSVPFGIAFDANGTLWFTADAAQRNYVGSIHP